MTSIVIAEKPSQAKMYRGFLGSRYGNIFAARGHLFELQEPEEVNPAWETWSIGILRPESGFYPPRHVRLPRSKKVEPDLKKRYDAIKAAAKHADIIYVATDPGREGEGIGTTIVNMLRREIKWSGTVLRVLPMATDKDSISKAFAGAEPGDKFKSTYQSFVARQQSDQIYNLSLTRTASVLFKPSGWNGALSVGRVITPTMGIVCRRELEIRNFVAEDYFTPWVEVSGEAGKVRLTHAPSEAHRIFDRTEAADLAEGAKSYSGPISVKSQRKRQAPPRLFSLSKLQVEAGRRYKWSIKKTADVLQTIYEAGAVTYPRTAEQSLPEAEIEYAPAMLEGILGIPGIEQVSWASKGPEIRVKKGAFSDDDLKGADHFAIVPNVATVNDWKSLYQKMSSDGQRLFELIARRYLSAIGPDRIYDSTRQCIAVKEREFAATGVVEVEPGWKEANGKAAPQPDDGDESSSALPPFVDGDAVEAVKVGVADKQTLPPPRYTDASLLDAMVDVWKHVEDPDVRDALKESKGIGTDATRTHIVQNLLGRGFIATTEKKGGALKATDAALEFFAILTRAAPRVLDVGLTGQMEILLEGICSGEAKAAPVVNEIVAIAEKAVTSMVEAKEAGAEITSSQQRAPTEGMKRAARAKAKSQGIRVPAGVLSDMTKCREFLGPPPERGAKGGAPSDKALAFARKIATDKGTELPEDALTDSKALSKWIDANKSGSGKKATGGRSGNSRGSAKGAGDGRPSSKQVGFAEKIAQRKRMEVPPECFQDRGAMSRWIDANKA